MKMKSFLTIAFKEVLEVHIAQEVRFPTCFKDEKSVEDINSLTVSKKCLLLLL